MNSEHNTLGKRPKNNVEAVLQNYKRCKVDRETRTWDWAAKELTATANLQEGSKIYVKFDVETTYIPGESEDAEHDNDADANDGEAPTGKNGSRGAAGDQGGVSATKDEKLCINTMSTSDATNVKDSKSSRSSPTQVSSAGNKVEDSKEATNKVGATDSSLESRRTGGITRTERILNSTRGLNEGAVKFRDEPLSFTSTFPGGSITTTIISEDESDDDEDAYEDDVSSRVERDENGKMLRVINEQVVWWPAVVKRAPTATCASLRETWAALESDSIASTQLTPSLRKELSSMIEERGDAPIWNVRYEPREDFDKEEDLEWCAFFVDHQTLVHLEKGKVCIAPYRKALEDGSCPEDTSSSQVSDVCALDALSAAIGVMETSVMSEISSSDPAETGQVARNSLEFAGKFGSLLKGFFAEMAQTSDRVVTPGDVWKFFDKFLTTSSGEGGESALGSSSSASDPLVNRTSSQSSEQPNGTKNDDLEEAPFPRMPESP